MTAEQKKACRKLIRALRSGKYAQAEGTLCWHRSDTKSFCYCVQGIAYKLIGYKELSYNMVKKGVNAVPVMGDTSKHYSSALELIDAYGLSIDEWRQLLNMNDFGKKSFKELADKLEEMVNQNV